MPFQTSDLLPILALVVWTLIMFVWMYITRVPAFQKAGIQPDDARHPDGGYNEKIPSNVRAVADNYNHLHEQPTLFYALVVFAALTGGGDNIFMYLAWAYVLLRMLHSLVQILSAKVAARFLVFAISTLVLMVMAGKEVIRVLSAPGLIG